MDEELFASDNERRTLAWIAPQRDTVPVLAEAIIGDPYTAIDDVEEIEEILKDLEAKGYAKQKDDVWTMTPKGLAALQS